MKEHMALPEEFAELRQARLDAQKALQTTDKARLQRAFSRLDEAWGLAAPAQTRTSAQKAALHPPDYMGEALAPGAEEQELNARLSLYASEFEQTRLVYEDLIRALHKLA